MISAGWLCVEALVFCVVCIFMQRIAYQHGIWDGAFNHFLPKVQREMMRYDEHRARKILELEGL